MFETMTPATIWSFQQKPTKGYLMLKLLLYKYRLWIIISKKFVLQLTQVKTFWPKQELEMEFPDGSDPSKH